MHSVVTVMDQCILGYWEGGGMMNTAYCDNRKSVLSHGKIEGGGEGWSRHNFLSLSKIKRS